MENENSQLNQGVAQPPVPPVQPVPNPTPVELPSQSGNKFLIFGILGGLGVVILLGLLTYFFFTSKPARNETSGLPSVSQAPVPVAKEEKSSVTSVNGVSDLDKLLIEVAQADDTMEKELTNLEKDSNF